jgi:hypothetical protein
MPNTFTAGELGNGTVTNSQAAIFTATADVATYVKGLALYNTNAADQTVQLWLKHSAGTARKWKRFVLAQNEHVDVIDGGDARMLENGTAIQAQTTTNGAVDYWIDGVEETT